MATAARDAALVNAASAEECCNTVEAELKCRITGSGKTLEVRTLGCARRSLLPLALALTAISKLSASNSQNKRHKVYTGLGHGCGVIPYSSVVWWIASWAEDE